MKTFKFPHRFRKSLDWLFKEEDKLQDQTDYFHIQERRKYLDNIKSLKRLLEDYRISLELERNRNSMLSMFIDSKLRNPPNIKYLCKHCTFKGKEYRDFCPGCEKDDSGKRAIDYKLISEKSTDSGK